MVVVNEFNDIVNICIHRSGTFVADYSRVIAEFCVQLVLTLSSARELMISL